MINIFGVSTRLSAIAAGQSLDIAPIWQQPGFKVMLGHMGVKIRLLAYPLLYLFPGILRIRKIIRAGIYISQCNYGIRRPLTAGKQVFDAPF